MLDANISPQEREAINKTLRDVLCNDGWGESHWDGLVKYLHKEHGLETDLVGLAQIAPCLFEMFQIGGLTHKGIIARGTNERLRQIIHQLVRIAFRADSGEEQALDQLKAIHKLALPYNYELPATVIKNLVDSYHISPHLARAWSVRRLMIDLSYVVEPTSKERSVLEGAVKLTTRNVNLLNSQIYKKAAKHIKKNTTLQSLAIVIYLEELDKEGIHLDPRTLKLDLQKLKVWEGVNLDPDDTLPLWNSTEYPPARLPMIPIYVEAWKTQRGRGDKKTKKLS